MVWVFWEFLRQLTFGLTLHLAKSGSNARKE